MWSRTAGVSLTCWLSEIWVEDCCGFDSSVRFTPSENQATVMGSVWGVMTSPEGTCVSAHTQYSVLETYLPPFWSVSETSFANYSHASFERTAHLSYRKSTVQNPCLFGTISVWIQRKTKQGKTCEKHHVSHLIPCEFTLVDMEMFEYHMRLCEKLNYCFLSLFVVCHPAEFVRQAKLLKSCLGEKSEITFIWKKKTL